MGRSGAAALLALAAVGGVPAQAQAPSDFWRRYAPDRAAILSSESKLWLSVRCTSANDRRPPGYALEVTITDPAGKALPEHRAAFTEIARNAGDADGIDGILVVSYDDQPAFRTIVLQRQPAGDTFRFHAALTVDDVAAIRAAPHFFVAFTLRNVGTLLRYPFSGIGSEEAVGQLACGPRPAAAAHAARAAGIPDFNIGEVMPAAVDRTWPATGRRPWKHLGRTLLHLAGRMDQGFEIFATGDRHLVYLVIEAAGGPSGAVPGWRVLAKATIVRTAGEVSALNCHPAGEQSAMTFVDRRTCFARGIVARGGQLVGVRWRVADAGICAVGS